MSYRIEDIPAMIEALQACKQYLWDGRFPRTLDGECEYICDALDMVGNRGADKAQRMVMVALTGSGTFTGWYYVQTSWPTPLPPRQMQALRLKWVDKMIADLRAYQAAAKEHPADDIYWFSSARLSNLGACSGGHDDWAAASGSTPRTDMRQVPVTLALATKMATRGRVYWAVMKMLAHKRITKDEFNKIHKQLDHDWFNYNRVAKAFMDLLATRAKREGRL